MAKAEGSQAGPSLPKHSSFVFLESWRPAGNLPYNFFSLYSISPSSRRFLLLSSTLSLWGKRSPAMHTAALPSRLSKAEMSQAALRHTDVNVKGTGHDQKSHQETTVCHPCLVHNSHSPHLCRTPRKGKEGLI